MILGSGRPSVKVSGQEGFSGKVVVVEGVEVMLREDFVLRRGMVGV